MLFLRSFLISILCSQFIWGPLAPVLARASSEGEQSRIRVTDRNNPRCPYCHEEGYSSGKPWVMCGIDGTAVHAECVAESGNNHCPSLGCAGEFPVTVEAEKTLEDYNAMSSKEVATEIARALHVIAVTYKQHNEDKEAELHEKISRLLNRMVCGPIQYADPEEMDYEKRRRPHFYLAMLDTKAKKFEDLEKSLDGKGIAQNAPFARETLQHLREILGEKYGPLPKNEIKFVDFILTHATYPTFSFQGVPPRGYNSATLSAMPPKVFAENLQKVLKIYAQEAVENPTSNDTERAREILEKMMGRLEKNKSFPVKETLTKTMLLEVFVLSLTTMLLNYEVRYYLPGLVGAGILLFLGGFGGAYLTYEEELDFDFIHEFSKELRPLLKSILGSNASDLPEDDLKLLSELKTWIDNPQTLCKIALKTTS